jgi:hypothetical protein
MTLDEARANVGKPVTYRPKCRTCPTEDGVISSVGRTLVFVVYEGDQHAKGTDPADLTPAGDKAATAAETEN